MKDTRAQAQAAWAAADKDASGSLGLEEMREVLRSIMGAAPTPEQLHFFRESLDVDRSGVVTQGEFVEWYIRTAIGPQGHLLKRTLIADPVGHTRPTSYKLPPDTFTYGKGTAGNAVSAGQSMWCSMPAADQRVLQPPPPTPARYTPCHLRVTTTAIHEWNAPNQRVKRYALPARESSPGEVFGVKGARDPTPTKKVLEGAFAPGGGQTAAYPANTSTQRMLERQAKPPLKQSGATRASTLRAEANAAHIDRRDHPREAFRIKRFDRAEPKIESYATKTHGAWNARKVRQAELAATQIKR